MTLSFNFIFHEVLPFKIFFHLIFIFIHHLPYLVLNLTSILPLCLGSTKNKKQWTYKSKRDVFEIKEYISKIIIDIKKITSLPYTPIPRKMKLLISRSTYPCKKQWSPSLVLMEQMSRCHSDSYFGFLGFIPMSHAPSGNPKNRGFPEKVTGAIWLRRKSSFRLMLVWFHFLWQTKDLGV